MGKKPWLALLAAVVWTTAAQAGGVELGKNLLKNGGAEAGTGSSNGGPVDSVPKWSPEGNFTVVQYGVSGFPTADSPGSARRGLNFFSGGPSNALSSAAKTVSLKALAGVIDAGGVQATLSGYLGGYGAQDDHVDLRVRFLDAGGTELAVLSLPTVLAADRGGVSGMLKRSAKAVVPAGSRSAQVSLTMVRTEGSYNDGYADVLSLVLK